MFTLMFLYVRDTDLLLGDDFQRVTRVIGVIVQFCSLLLLCGLKLMTLNIISSSR